MAVWGGAIEAALMRDLCPSLGKGAMLAHDLERLYGLVVALDRTPEASA